MSRKRKPGVDPSLPGYVTSGRIRKYQMDPRWDEMTADERAEVEDMDAEEREAWLDSEPEDDSDAE